MGCGCARAGRGEGGAGARPLEEGADAAIFHFRHGAAPDISHLAAGFAARHSLCVFVRPAGKGCSWLWIVGDLDFCADLSKGQPFASLEAAWLASRGSAPVAADLARLDARLQPRDVVLRATRAQHWATTPQVVGRTVLIGDAANGKPFYSGTTLNHHLLDVYALIAGERRARFHPPLDTSSFEAYAQHQVLKRSIEARLREDDGKRDAETTPRSQGTGHGSRAPTSVRTV